MLYSSNINTVIDQLNVKLRGIQDTDSLAQKIAVSLATSNKRRIHNESKDVSGSEITYKRSRKTPTRGAYSKSWASVRSKAGRQISKVDFQFRGDLFRNFEAEPIPGGWGVGWTTSLSAKVSEALEKGFGDVWGVTVQDSKAINAIVTKEINKKLK